MLAKAGQKKIYEILECDDVTAFLGKETTRYDLFLATDLFIYFGRLDNLFQAVSRLAAGKAIFAFSLERHDGPEEYVLNPSGRYSHSPLYLQAVAEAAGFSVLHHSEHDIRKENGIWIPGDLYILEVNSYEPVG
jgi:predicted TPR repeat methyltransferase